MAVNVGNHVNGTANLPIGAIVEVLSGPSDSDAMIDVLWDGRTVAAFSIDLNVRATEIVDKSTGAQRHARVPNVAETLVVVDHSRIACVSPLNVRRFAL